MTNYNALPACSAAEGVVVSGPNITTVSTVGAVGALVAGSAGVAIGRFGWFNADGIVNNLRQSASDIRGLVVADIPPNSTWRNVFYDAATDTWRIREGLPVTLVSIGLVGVRFQYPAWALDPVYANVLDGSPISGYSAAGELTPWTVVNDTPQKAIALIRNQ